MTAAELANDEVINEAFSDLVCPEAETTTCPPSEYRTMDGFCNNMANPEWGQAFTPQTRFIQAEYGKLFVHIYLKLVQLINNMRLRRQ